MSLVFYTTSMSSATPTHACLEELGIPYEKVTVDLKAGDQQKPQFLKLNPNGKVPVLVHDGVSVFESAAIAIYLGETFGAAKQLWPTGAARGQAMSWIVWTNVSVGEALSRYQHNSSDRIPAERHNAKAAAVGHDDVERHLRMLDQALAGKTYLVGDTYTLADCHAASWMTYVGYCGFDLSGYPALHAWIGRCSSRPATSRAQ